MYRPADVGGVLVGQAGDKIVAGCELSRRRAVSETLEGAQAGDGVSGGKIQLADRGHGGIERVKSGRHRMHVRNIIRSSPIEGAAETAR